jgi:hypothetical protein
MFIFTHVIESALEMVSRDLGDPRTIIRSLLSSLLSAGYQPVAKPHILEDQGFYSLRHVAYHG